MKYLDYPELETLSRALTFESAECKVFTRLEAYSCKSVSKERRILKSLESAYAQSASQSPPDYLDEVLASPFGRLDQPGALKTLFLLIATLNSAFPDHDFSQVNPLDFRRETSSANVLNSLSTTLLSLRSSSNAPRSYSSFPSSHDAGVDGMSRSAGSGGSPPFGPHKTQPISHPTLATVLDDIMSIPECEVFTYHPDAESDPHASAEPDEEGSDLEEDAYWSDDGDAQMAGIDVGTPRPRGQDMDAPMFDEDLDGGFNGAAAGGDVSGSSISSGGPRTPLTPSSARHRAGDYFSGRRAAAGGYAVEDDDDDLIDGMAGLLWATYAFFYNRKLKRILFVSVWSRRNPRFGLGPSVPSFSAGYSQGTGVAPQLPTTPLWARDDVDELTPNPSPAKRAISRTMQGRRRERTASGSPAPSSLSPFPHDSPGSGTTGGAPRVVPSSKLGQGAPRTGFASLDAAVMSSSAPAAGRAQALSSRGGGESEGGKGSSGEAPSADVLGTSQGKRRSDAMSAAAKKPRTAAPTA